jgi:hypothetical protein
VTTDTEQIAGTTSAELSDWRLASDYLKTHPTRWGRSLNWIAARPLLESLNDRLSRWSGGLIYDLRHAWVPQPPELVEHPDATRFMIIGDTGEQDRSQYVVAPALSRAVRGTPDEPKTAFVLMMSDIIYPAGAVDDYIDGLYKPYRSIDDPNFRIDVPMLALPGNHDWYDGLAGFMFHFCGEEKLHPAAYARPKLSPLAQLFRILWRRPPAPRADTRQARDTIGVGHTQPGPYFAIKTRHVLLVAIDTGIDGTIDEAQWAWLRDISTIDSPKILITGKPLVVNARVEPCWVGPAPRSPYETGRTSLWRDLVGNPRYNYVATIGGDVHNYKRYIADPATDPPGAQVHIVAGGGGAYMHATHSYALAVNDSRLVANPHVLPHAQPDESDPTPAQSLNHFARLLIPSMRRTVYNLALCICGVLAVTGIALFARAASEWAGYVGWFALVALIVLGLIRLARSRDERDEPLPRALVAIGSFTVGALAAVIAYRLDPRHYLVYLLVWFAATSYHVLLNLCVRKSGWWRPANEFFKPVGWEAFAVGLAGLTLMAFGFQVLLDGVSLPAYLSSALILIAGIVGWRLRGKPSDEAIPRHYQWYRWGATIGAAVQAICFVIIFYQLTDRVGRTWMFSAVWQGILAVIGILLATALVLVVGTDLAALVGWWPSRGYLRAWGLAATVSHHLSLPLLLAGAVVWWLIAKAYEIPASAGLPFALLVPAALLLAIGGLRRRLGRAYVIITVPGLIAGALVAYGTWAEPVRMALGAAVVIFAAGLAAVIGHIAFLAIYKIWTTPGADQPPRITQQDFELILAERADPKYYPQPGLAENVRQWSRLTAPSLGEPGGPLQKGIAEIFSVDRPPFFKGFLQLDTTESTCRILLHRTNGVEHLPPQVVFTIQLKPGEAEPNPR